VVIPGLALHVRYPLVKLAGDPLRLDVIGTDLGWVTIGKGLLIEQTPLEGVMAGLTWRGAELRYMFAGRGLWDGDDVEAYALSVLGGRAQLTTVAFQQGAPGPIGSHGAPAARYATAAFDQPLGGGFRVAGEGAAKGASGVPLAGLLRLDYVRQGGPLSVHTGVQLRFYQQRFGPHDDLVPPSWRFATPLQQDAYVTNPIEFYYLTHDFDVWSHTLMLEVRLRLTERFELVGDGEQWLRVAVRGGADQLVTPDGFQAPGHRVELFYRGGLRFYPWAGWRHRASLFFTNKQILAGGSVTDAIQVRFRPDAPLWLLTLEAFL
jgi:hypothetical protein